jgi:ribosomal-protein-alanine N-acetyltransferase
MTGIVARLFGRSEPAIVEAKPGDAADLAATHARSFRHGWSEMEFERLLSDRAAVCHIARAAKPRGTIAGFVLSRRAQDEAEILMVAVLPSERGRGLARRLLARHLGRLASLGVTRVLLEVDEGNAPALKLYERAGFEQVGRRPGYYPRPEGSASALILRRDLR